MSIAVLKNNEENIDICYVFFYKIANMNAISVLLNYMFKILLKYILNFMKRKILKYIAN